MNVAVFLGTPTRPVGLLLFRREEKGEGRDGDGVSDCAAGADARRAAERHEKRHVLQTVAHRLVVS